MELLLPILVGICGFAIGAIIVVVLNKRSVNSAENRAEDVIKEANKEVQTIIREGKIEVKEQLQKNRIEFERSTKEQKKEIRQQEQWLEQKKENLDKRVDIIEQREKDYEQEKDKLTKKKQLVEQSREHVQQLIQKEELALQKTAGLSKEEAVKRLMEKLEREVEYEAATYIRKKQQEAHEEAEKNAKNIISQAIQRSASDHVAETTVCSVSLPSDDLKGRIIGREGRNIRALEQGTGVEILIDDTPNAVVISGFDPIRREIARRTLERLIADGRIHPARIEEILKKVKKSLDKEIIETGTKSALELGISGLAPELLRLIGRLRFRTSYGQNLLNHSMEVARIMSIMAEELNENVERAKIIGLLHDLGKAVDHEVEGPHAVIGADIARRQRLPEEIINAIAAHHNEVEPKSVLAVLASAADAISAARPGARSEAYDMYLKRIESLEKIATESEGVQNAYAIQAGREVRVMVNADEINDNQAIATARNIAKRVSDEMQFPGEIKVMVVRETRVTEYAR